MKDEFKIAETFGVNFIYPEEYVLFLDFLDKLKVTHWWFLGTTEGVSKYCYDYINVSGQSKKLLIPFAKNDELKILACFDLEQQVWFCGLQNDPIKDIDWKERRPLPNFSVWLERVLKGDL